MVLIQALFCRNQFYVLQEILESRKLTEAEFILKHPQIEISKMKKVDLIKATTTLSQLEQRHFKTDDPLKHEEEVNIIYRSSQIDEILDISSTVIK